MTLRWQRFVWGMALGVTLVTSAIGCRGRGGADDLGLSATLAFAPTPPVTGPNPVIITLTDETGAPVSGASVRLEGTMTHAGMVPVFSDVESVGTGQYRAPAFSFTMGGDWVIFVHVTLADGRSGRIERRVRVVSAPSPSAERSP